MNHLSAGEKLTPDTEDAEPDHQDEHDRIGNQIAPLIMDRLIIIVAQTHQADSRNIYENNRTAGKHRPENIPNGPSMLSPLRDADPT